MPLIRNRGFQKIVLGCLVDDTNDRLGLASATVKVVKDGTVASGVGSLTLINTAAKIISYMPSSLETDCTVFSVFVDDIVTPAVQPLVYQDWPEYRDASSGFYPSVDVERWADGQTYQGIFGPFTQDSRLLYAGVATSISSLTLTVSPSFDPTHIQIGGQIRIMNATTGAGTSWGAQAIRRITAVSSTNQIIVDSYPGFAVSGACFLYVTEVPTQIADSAGLLQRLYEATRSR